MLLNLPVELLYRLHIQRDPLKEVSKPLVTVMLQVGREVVRELDLLSQAVYMGVERLLQLLVVVGEHGTLVKDLLNLVL